MKLHDELAMCNWGMVELVHDVGVGHRHIKHSKHSLLRPILGEDVHLNRAITVHFLTIKCIRRSHKLIVHNGKHGCKHGFTHKLARCTQGKEKTRRVLGIWCKLLQTTTQLTCCSEAHDSLAQITPIVVGEEDDCSSVEPTNLDDVPSTVDGPLEIPTADSPALLEDCLWVQILAILLCCTNHITLPFTPHKLKDSWCCEEAICEINIALRQALTDSLDNPFSNGPALYWLCCLPRPQITCPFIKLKAVAVMGSGIVQHPYLQPNLIPFVLHVYFDGTELAKVRDPLTHRLPIEPHKSSYQQMQAEGCL